MRIETERVKPVAFCLQTLSSITIGYLTTLTGFVYAWPSYTVENFASNQTVLSYPMSPMEISLLGSLTNVGGLLATPFCGYILDNIGRKHGAMLFGFPFIISWSILSLTSYVPLVLAAVFIAGFGAGGQALSCVYISEIAQDAIRGGLATVTVSGFFLGLLFSYVLGGWLEYHQVVYTHLSLSVLYVVMLSFLKESPVFLLQKGNEEEAAKSIAFYRHLNVKSKQVDIELKKIKFIVDPRIATLLQGENDLESADKLTINKGEKNTVKTVSPWKFLMKSESSKRALVTVLILMAFSILMGSIVLQVYAVPLFKEAVPSMSPSLCAIFLALDFLVSSLLCALIVDKYGRKSLMTITSGASGICTLLLGTQLQAHWAPHWVTALLIYSFCFIYTLGAATVPFILTAEVFLPEVRGICNSMAMACMWVFNFVTLMVFNPENLGLGPVFYAFAIISFLAALYSQLCLPETKALSVNSIQTLFVKSSKGSVSVKK